MKNTAIRNLKDNSKRAWLADFYTDGREGKRIRKRFVTKGEAVTFEHYTLKQIIEKPWLGEKSEHRRLSALIEIWFTMYGVNLSNGDVIYQKFIHMVTAMNNPVAASFSARTYADFSRQRMAGEISFVDAKWQKGALTYGRDIYNRITEGYYPFPSVNSYLI